MMAYFVALATGRSFLGLAVLNDLLDGVTVKCDGVVVGMIGMTNDDVFTFDGKSTGLYASFVALVAFVD